MIKVSRMIKVRAVSKEIISYRGQGILPFSVLVLHVNYTRKLMNRS